MDWKSGDPRSELVGLKHAAIVILRPHRDGGKRWEAGTAHVEMKHGWYIHTSFDDHSSIEKWDPDWLWTRAPGRP